MSDAAKRILYVDDDPDSCELMSVWLTADGTEYDVTVVSTAQDANMLIADAGFDLYILDYCLPELSGAELCRAIREIDVDVPVIVYSAIARPVDRETASEAGVDLYLVKPDDLDRLKPAISHLLRKKFNNSFAVSPS